jgi:hypothetical protein
MLNILEIGALRIIENPDAGIMSAPKEMITNKLNLKIITNNRGGIPAPSIKKIMA